MVKTIKFVCRDLNDNLNAIYKTTGKNRFLTAVDMLWCVVFRLVLPSEYYSFGFDIIPRSKRKDYATQHRRQKITRALNKTSSLNVLSKSITSPGSSRIFLAGIAYTHWG